MGLTCSPRNIASRRAATPRASASSTSNRIVSGIAFVYILLFRGTPLLVQLFWFYYALPLVGVSFDPITTGIMVLSLLTGAFGAEVVRVGRAAGHRVEALLGIEAQRVVDAAEGRGLESVEADLAAAAQKNQGGRPSFLQDVMKGRRTEVDYLNGFVAAEGRRLGVDTPFNDAVVAAVHRFPVGKLTPDPQNLEPLLALLPR